MTPSDRHHLVSRLFAEALEISEADRAAFLRTATEDEDVISTVTEMLRAHGTNDGFLDRPPLIRFADKEERIQRQIGPWTLVDRLGEGGMGVVYRARRSDGLYDREVALKLLAADPLLSSGDKLSKRMAAERQILARLDHDGIARMYDGGVTEEGLPYLALELVDGSTVTSYATEKSLSVPDRVRLFVRVCEAVSYAHRNLIVHRDIKPAHILVFDREGTTVPGIKLLDFGISTLLESTDDSGQTLFTAPAAMTPAYASPEQVARQPISTSSDIYSLGVVLYELLAGRRPYDLSGKTASEIERLVVEIDPPIPSSAATTEIGRALKGDLDTIVMKAIAKEPERRYASVDGLADDLQRFLDGEPVRARPSTAGYRLRKYVQRHRVGVGIAAAVILLGGLLSVFYTIQVARERDRTAEALERSEQTLAFLREIIVAGGVEEGDPDIPIGEVLDSAAVRAQSFDAQSEVASEIHLTLGGVFRDLGKMESAEREARRTLALFQDDDRNEDYGRALQLLALAKMGQDDLDGALEDVESALEYLPDVGPVDDRNLVVHRASALNTYADILSEMDDRMDDAEEAYAESIRLYRLADDRDVTTPLSGLAIVYNITGRQDEAIPLFSEIVDSLRTQFDRPHYRLGIALANLGATYNDLSRFDEARPVLKESVDVFEASVGLRQPNAFIAHVTYGLHLFRSGDTEAAISEGAKYLPTGIETFGPDHSLTAFAQNVAGQAYCAGGRADEGADMLRKSNATRRNVLPEGHWLTSNGASLLGDCYARAGRDTDAERMLTDGYSGLKETLGPDHVKTLEAEDRLRAFFEETGRTADLATLPDRVQ